MSKPISVRVIERAIELIEDRKRWTMSAEAMREDGSLTHVFEPDAVKFCMNGAVKRAAYELTAEDKIAATDLANKVIDELHRFVMVQTKGASVAHVNDDRELGKGRGWRKQISLAAASRRNHPRVLKLLREFVTVMES